MIVPCCNLITNFLRSSNQPKTIFVSDNAPSPINFLKLRMSALSTGPSSAVRQNIVCNANSTAPFALSSQVISPSSTTVIISSINPSMKISLGWIKNKSGIAFPICLLSLYICSIGGISCQWGDWISCGFQFSLSSFSWARSITISLAIQNFPGPSFILNGHQLSMYPITPTIGMHITAWSGNMCIHLNAVSKSVLFMNSIWVLNLQYMDVV